MPHKIKLEGCALSPPEVYQAVQHDAEHYVAMRTETIQHASWHATPTDRPVPGQRLCSKHGI